MTTGTRGQSDARKGSGVFQDAGSLQIPEKTRKEFSPRVSRRDQPCPHRPEPCETDFRLLASASRTKAMASHSSTLAWKIPGTEETDGLTSMGSHRVRHD